MNSFQTQITKNSKLLSCMFQNVRFNPCHITKISLGVTSSFSHNFFHVLSVILPSAFFGNLANSSGSHLVASGRRVWLVSTFQYRDSYTNQQIVNMLEINLSFPTTVFSSLALNPQFGASMVDAPAPIHALRCGPKREGNVFTLWVNVTSK